MCIRDSAPCPAVGRASVRAPSARRHRLPRACSCSQVLPYNALARAGVFGSQARSIASSSLAG
eukprot:4223969-Alexandrium_andersonii.AAC.1